MSKDFERIQKLTRASTSEKDFITISLPIGKINDLYLRGFSTPLTFSAFPQVSIAWRTTIVYASNNDMTLQSGDHFTALEAYIYTRVSVAPHLIMIENHSEHRYGVPQTACPATGVVFFHYSNRFPDPGPSKLEVTSSNHCNWIATEGEDMSCQ